MQFGKSILEGQTLNAASCNYGDCEAKQIVCPICYEPVFLKERVVESRDDITSYFSHYRKQSSNKECELRVKSMTQAEVDKANAVARGQTLKKFREGYKETIKSAFIKRIKSMVEDTTSLRDKAKKIWLFGYLIEDLDENEYYKIFIKTQKSINRNYSIDKSLDIKEFMPPFNVVSNFERIENLSVDKKLRHEAYDFLISGSNYANEIALYLFKLSLFIAVFFPHEIELCDDDKSDKKVVESFNILLSRFFHAGNEACIKITNKKILRKMNPEDLVSLLNFSKKLIERDKNSTDAVEHRISLLGDEVIIGIAVELFFSSLATISV